MIDADRRFPLATTLMAAIAVSCIAGCERPPSPRASDKLIARAWADFRLSDFSKAAIEFQQVLDQSQQLGATRLRLEAEYGLATIANLGDDADPAKARSLYDQIIHEAPTSDLAGWSQLSLVRMQQQTSGTDSLESRKQLDDGYRVIVASFPDSPPADEAFVQLQALRLTSLSPQDASQVVSDITAYLAREKTHFAQALYGLRGIAYGLCKQYQLSFNDAVTSLQRKERLPATVSFSDAGALYRLGVQAQFDVGDFASARRFYQQFLDEYPSDKLAFTVHLLMKNMDKVETEMAAAGPAPVVPEGP